jgi:cellulose biosynthesis protein BcsQ
MAPSNRHNGIPATTPPKCISFVSGKGGVGKTFVAANFAFCCSLSMKVLLLDCDFQNQGLTGLFAGYLTRSMTGAYDWLLGEQRLSATDFIEIRPNLCFLPAFSDMRRQEIDWASHRKYAIVNRFRSVIKEAVGQLGIDLVILDCHGGLDELSFASHVASDLTIIVTEADRVTFNGTLELLEFYLGGRQMMAKEVQYARCVGTDDLAIDREVTPTHFVFLFNRIVNRLDYNLFAKKIQEEFIKNIPDLRKSVFDTVFLPSDSLAVRSFSEYPFFIEIVPETMLAKKIAILFKSLFPDMSELIRRVPQWTSLNRRQAEIKIRRYVGSPDDDRSRAVFGGFGLAQLTMFLTMLPVWIGVDTKPNILQITLIAIFTTITCCLLLYIYWLDLKVAGFYKIRLRYESRIRGFLKRSVDLSYYLRISRLVSLRLLTHLCGMLLFAEMAATIALAVLAATGKLL